MTENQVAMIKQALLRRLNIVVTGGTGSGKTLLANAVIAVIVRRTPERRLVILEDTAEFSAPPRTPFHSIQRTQPTWRGSSSPQCAATRPDHRRRGSRRRRAHAAQAVEYWAPGGIHANSALSALRRLEQLTAPGEPAANAGVIGEAVDVVVSIERTPTGRRIREVTSIEGFAGGQYQIETFAHQGHSDAA